MNMNRNRFSITSVLRHVDDKVRRLFTGRDKMLRHYASAVDDRADGKIDDMYHGKGYRFLYIEKIPFYDFPVYSAIIHSMEAKRGLAYLVIEPTLTEQDRRNLLTIKRILREEMMLNFSMIKSGRYNKDHLIAMIDSISKRYSIPLGRSFTKISYYAVRDLLHLYKIEPLLHDHMIEDISCDGPDIPVYVWHREYESLPTNITFNNNELDSFIMRLSYLAGKHVSLSLPIVDASLPDGSRINLTFGSEITKKGSTFTIRRFRADPITIIDLIQFRTVSAELAAYLWYAIEKGMSILIVGGTASGKTTLLNALAMLVPLNHKIVSIEDTPELNLPHENWIQSVSRQMFVGQNNNEITLFDLLRAALRQRPDVIIVGETRGKEAYTLFQAMATGHGGFATMHADSIDAALTRLTSPPMDVPPSLIASSLDIIVLQLRIKAKNSGRNIRRIMEVGEIKGLDGKDSVDSAVIDYNITFSYNPSLDEQVYNAKSVVIEKICERYGLDVDTVETVIRQRKYVLDMLVEKNVRRYSELVKYLMEYYRNPTDYYNRLRVESGLK